MEQEDTKEWRLKDRNGSEIRIVLDNGKLFFAYDTDTEYREAEEIV